MSKYNFTLMTFSNIWYRLAVCCVILVSLFSCVEEDVTMAQKPEDLKNDSLSVSLSALNFGSKADTIELKITCQSRWRAYVTGLPTTETQWCSPSVKEGVGDKIIEIVVLTNDGLDSRQTTLYVSNEWGRMCRIEVTQNGMEETELNPSSLSFVKEGQAHTVNLRSNVFESFDNIDIVVSHDWISVEKIPTYKACKVTVATNPENTVRNGFILFSNAKEGFSAKVEVSQEGFSERDILIELYNALDGSKWVNQCNWTSTQNLSSWHGITTNDKGQVIAINLPNNGMTGRIPDVVAKLNALISLDLSGNNINFLYLPTNFQRLESLIMRNNAVATLDIEYLMAQPKLRVLEISNCYIGSRFPAFLAPNLTMLTISGCGLTGDISSSIINLNKLRLLDVSDNQLTTVPITIGNLKELQVLNLSKNRIKTLPPTIVGLGQLTDLYVSRNLLTELPDILANLNNLTLIEADNNLITAIGQDAIMAPNLKSLSLQNNKITGELPTYLTQATNLIYLYLSGNRLSGTIDQSIIDSEWFRSWFTHCKLCNQYGIGFTNCTASQRSN